MHHSLYELGDLFLGYLLLAEDQDSLDHTKWMPKC